MKPVTRNFSIPTDVDRDLRRVAYEDQRSMSGILVEGLRLFLAQRNGEEIPEPDRQGI